MNAGVPKWQLCDSQLTRTWSSGAHLPPFTSQENTATIRKLEPSYYHWQFQNLLKRRRWSLVLTTIERFERVFLLSGLEFSFSRFLSEFSSSRVSSFPSPKTSQQTMRFNRVSFSRVSSFPSPTKTRPQRIQIQVERTSDWWCAPIQPYLNQRRWILTCLQSRGAKRVSFSRVSSFPSPNKHSATVAQRVIIPLYKLTTRHEVITSILLSGLQFSF